MPSKVIQCHLCSNDQLIHNEVAHRRAIAGYATGLTLTVATGVATFGTTTPIVVPIAGFKVYKIRSHYKKLKAVREELSRRNLSPNEKKKRDVLIPVTITAVIYLASIGIAGVFDIVPDAIQAVIHEPIQEGFTISDDLLFAAGNKYEAFFVAEAAEASFKFITDDTKYPNIKPDKHQSHYQ